jgi:polyribonucleotide nucleotidyltransferase
VVSEVLESNGSSMATVCAGTLALMDAGIQLIRPVSELQCDSLLTEAVHENLHKDTDNFSVTVEHETG